MKIKTSLILLFILIIADQITKLWVLQAVDPTNPIAIIPGFFNLVLVYNPGVAFGFMSSWDPILRIILISLISIFAVSFLLYLYFKSYRDHFYGSIAIVLILSGAIGNIIDRVRLSMVVDFLDFYVANWHWPAFNLADSFICVGVGILLLLDWKPKESS